MIFINIFDSRDDNEVDLYLFFIFYRIYYKFLLFK